MSQSRVLVTVVAGCTLYGAANALAAFRSSFPLPDIGPHAAEHIIPDRVLVCALYRFTLSHREDPRYAALVNYINEFMMVVAESERAGSGVGFQFRATRLADDAIRIATELRAGVDVDVEDISAILTDNLHNIMVL